MAVTPGANRTTLENILRTKYIPSMRMQFARNRMPLQMFRRRKRNVKQGLKLSFPVHKGVSGGVRVTTGDDLPAAASQKVARGELGMYNMFGQIQVSKSLIDDAKKGDSSDVEALVFEMSQMVDQMADLQAWFLYKDGSGKLAQPASSTDSTTIVVDDLGPLKTGMRVDVLLISSGLPNGVGCVNADISVNHNTNTVTLVDGTLSDYATLHANASDYAIYLAASYNKVFHGMAGIVSASNPPQGAYANIDRTTAGNEYWMGNESDQNGAITLRAIQGMIDTINRRKPSGTMVDLIVAGELAWNEIAEILVDLKRYDGNQMKLNGWAQAINFAGIPIVKDWYCPTAEMFFLCLDTWRLWLRDDGQWMDDDGAILSRVPGLYGFEATYSHRIELMCDCPGANGRIYGITAAA